jgi:hypothetical protein
MSCRDDVMCQEDLAHVGENMRRSGFVRRSSNIARSCIGQEGDDNEGIDERDESH